MWPQQTGSHSQSIPLCNSLEAASTSSSCCSLVSSSSLEASWASRPPRYSWPPCPFRTHGPPLGLLNVEGFHMMTLHHGETDDKQDDIDNTIYHEYMQDDNTGEKVRRNKLVVIVIDGWVNSTHQLFLRRKINKEIDFKAKRLIFTLLLLIHSKLNLGFVGTTLTSTTRRPVASWSASRSSWKPAFAPSTSSPSSRQSPSPPGKQYKPVCFVVKKKTPLMFPLHRPLPRDPWNCWQPVLWQRGDFFFSIWWQFLFFIQYLQVHEMMRLRKQSSFYAFFNIEDERTTDNQKWWQKVSNWFLKISKNS